MIRTRGGGGNPEAGGGAVIRRGYGGGRTDLRDALEQVEVVHVGRILGVLQTLQLRDKDGADLLRRRGALRRPRRGQVRAGRGERTFIVGSSYGASGA
jgi:hypothetical protein